ncbi:hypothetical protein HanPI659440_Chr17g0668301 [Helianthus annuus]|nr:hypothetical protein HanPI659440_Chr17g0668301 [Helianthus annuus]
MGGCSSDLGYVMIWVGGDGGGRWVKSESRERGAERERGVELNISFFFILLNNIKKLGKKTKLPLCNMI